MVEFEQHEIPSSTKGMDAIIDHGLEKPCKILLRKTADGNYSAVYGTGVNTAGKQFGSTATTSTELAALVQSIFTSGLTAGRTWVEKLVMHGDFNICTDGTTPSLIPGINTEIELIGTVTVHTNSWGTLFQDGVTANNIIFTGGTWNGNKTSASIGFLNFSEGTGVTLRNTVITDWYDMPLTFTTMTDVSLLNVNISNNGTTGSPVDGANISGGSRLRVINCVFNNNMRHGLYAATTTRVNIRNTEAINNNQYHTTGHGISLTGTNYSIVGNWAYDDQGTKYQTYGINCTGDYGLISDNYCVSNAHATYDINWTTTNKNVKVINNVGRYVQGGIV